MYKSKAVQREITLEIFFSEIPSSKSIFISMLTQIELYNTLLEVYFLALSYPFSLCWSVIGKRNKKIIIMCVLTQVILLPRAVFLLMLMHSNIQLAFKKCNQFCRFLAIQCICSYLPWTTPALEGFEFLSWSLTGCSAVVDQTDSFHDLSQISEIINKKFVSHIHIMWLVKGRFKKFERRHETNIAIAK